MLRGLSGTHFHDLRRSGVRNLIRGGASISQAMAVSGHRTMDTFLRYDIVDERDIRQAVEGAMGEARKQRRRKTAKIKRA